MNRLCGAARVAALAVIAVAVVAAPLSCASDERATVDTRPIKSSKTLGTTHGPNGEKATPTSALRLTPSEVAKVRAGHHTAALVWHENADFTTAVTAGARDEFERLGIEVVAETSANFDAAKQKADIETVDAEEAVGAADPAGRPGSDRVGIQGGGKAGDEDRPALERAARA